MAASPEQASPKDGGRLMAVDADLVREHLVGSLLRAAQERLVTGMPAESDTTIAAELDGPVRVDLARLGYLARVVELERFEPARQPMPWLAELVSERSVTASVSRIDAMRTISGELARAEPEERPHPDSGAASWRVPGPGGHVRHYLATAALERRREAAVDLAASDDRTATVAELKHCWMFGFFLRCCEEA